MSESRNQLLISTIGSVLQLPAEDITDDVSTDTVKAWDSVTHLNLIVAVEEAFNVAFSPDETIEMTSVKMIRLVLADKLGV